MTDAVLRVVFAGPHVSVQDAGRPGQMRFGVPGSGPLDGTGFAAARLALGNPADAPAIEVSPGGLTLDCLSGSVGFAVAGGGFIVDHIIDQAAQRGGSWQVATLRAGDRLVIRPGPWGSWCYLALAGTLVVPRWLGSAATHALSGLGGGRLRAGQELRVTGTAEADAAPIPCPVFARPRHRLRVTLGPQDRFFGPAALAALLDRPWRVTDARDRMGTRLAGPMIAPDATLDMPSEPIARGSVQVAGDGVPTVLLADHQTTGGYPKIATVLDCDLDGFAQTRPGDPVVFVPVTAARAVAIARTAARARAGYAAALQAYVARRPDDGHSRPSMSGGQCAISRSDAPGLS